MNNELKQIKKRYGENFSHLCRKLFPTILENEGMLLEILTEHFEYNNFLYDDIKSNKKIEELKDYIYNLYNRKIYKLEIEQKEKINATPEELMGKVGYILKECKSEEEIQEYRKYYTEKEKLCTFNGGRLNTCRVFFAVKKNVADIKRENFKNPRRQDEYGTSVISIQFTKDGTNTLSIKNRYNHAVSNPDCTFSNDLENIIAGLTESFENTYGIVQKYQGNNFEIPGYVLANDGKYYKYNYEINNIYYCPNNIIINNFKVKKYDKEKYIVLDYFILDLVNKEIHLYDNKLQDSFIDGINNISKINVVKGDSNKHIILVPNNGENIEILLNNKNEIIKYKNTNLKKVENNFLYKNMKLKEIECPNLQIIGSDFLNYNKGLKNIALPNVEKIGFKFLYFNTKLEQIECSNLQIIEDNFLYSNNAIKVIQLPSLKIIGNKFLNNNEVLTKIECPNLQIVGSDFLHYNSGLKNITLPNVEKIGDRFLYFNTKLERIECPNLQEIEDSFLFKNKMLKSIQFLNLKNVGNGFLNNNKMLERIECPNLQTIKSNFLYSNKNLKSITLPELQQLRTNFLYYNIILEQIECPNLQEIEDNFLYFNKDLKSITLPELQQVGTNFLYFNTKLEQIEFPKLHKISFNFLYFNEILKVFKCPNLQNVSPYYISKMNKHISEMFLNNKPKLL